MRLGIISDAHHYWSHTGTLMALTPVVRQFEQWADLFDSVTVCAPLIAGLAPPSHNAYKSPKITLLPTRAAGGTTLRAKVHLAAALPEWWTAIGRLLRSVDAVHVRCPNNISIIGLMRLMNVRLPAQAVYTGNWEKYRGEPITYAAQRLWLRHVFSGPVAAYTTSATDDHVYPSFSPAFDEAQWKEEAGHIAARLKRIENGCLRREIKLISVGALDRNKNHTCAIDVVRLLMARGLFPQLRLVGEGPELQRLQNYAAVTGVASQVHFIGGISRPRLVQHYRWADVLIQASHSEGFSKVVAEAMLHGNVPVISHLPLNVHLVDSERGFTFDPADASGAAQAIAALAESPPEPVCRIIENVRRFCRDLTLECWKEHVRGMIAQRWNLDSSTLRRP